MDIVPKHNRNEILLRRNLREKGKYKIISLAICDNNDLIAMGLVSSFNNTTGLHGPNQSDLDFFKVHLLSISCGGSEHPASRNPTLSIKNISRVNHRETQMKIHTNLLAVHFMCTGLFPSKLWILDWKT